MSFSNIVQKGTTFTNAYFFFAVYEVELGVQCTEGGDFRADPIWEARKNCVPRFEIVRVRHKSFVGSLFVTGKPFSSPDRISHLEGNWKARIITKSLF